jgi:NitT/TauT family transport system substrate-binding protein
MTTTRRRFIAGTAAGVALTLGSGLPRIALAASEVRKVRITQAITSLAFIQNYVAQQLGYFKEAGLDAEIIVTQGGGPDVQAVLAGDAAFTVNDGAQVLPALAKGQRLICLLSTLDRNLINVTMNKAVADKLRISDSTPIDQKLAALKGLKIGITRPGALTWQLARFNLAKAGFNPDRDATVVGLGGGLAVAAALEKGDVDVIYISVPLGERVVHAGKGITLIDNARGEDPSLPSFLMEGLWTTPDFMAKNPNTCQAAVRALHRASTFIRNSDVPAIAKVLSPTFSAFGADVLRIGVEKTRPAVSASGRIDQKALDYTQEVLSINKIIDRKFLLNQIFDPRFIG